MSSTVFRDHFSGFSHLFGAIMAIAGLCVLVAQATLYGDAWHIVSFAIFGTCMILMFAASTVYHLVNAKEHVILLLKRIDHMAIFIMIAGTYTPICLVPLRGTTGWLLFGIVWGLAIAGIFMKAFWIGAPRWLSTVIYLGMGWISVFAIPPLLDTAVPEVLDWLIYGGICYTLGAVNYATKWPDPWPKHFGFHEIWHLFVMGGAFCHFMAVLYLV